MQVVFALLLFFCHALGQEFFGMPQRGPNMPVSEPLINEGSPDCAQFIYAPNSLSAKCLVHELTVDSGRYEPFSISLTGLDTPDFSNTVELTFGVNQCRQSFEISCIQSDYCTVGYLNNGFKGIVKAKGLRFGINGDLISAEVVKYGNQGIQNIYQCRTSVNMLSSDKLRYEVRVYLNKAFAGHNIELNGGNVRKYSNGEQAYTTTTEQPTEPSMPFVPGYPGGAGFPFPPFPVDQTTQVPEPTTQPTLNIVNGRSDGSKFGEVPLGVEMNKNAMVTVNGMQKSPDGKSMLLDITIRTQVQVPNSFF